MSCRWAVAGWVVVVLLSPGTAAGQPAPPGVSPRPSEVARQAPVKQAPVKNVEDEVRRLLGRLKDLQDARQSGRDPWALTIKELIELGPAATPALIRALRETPVDERRMLRSIPFVLRGIGDKRAVPALIATLPKCYGNDGSDMGYNTKDKELLAFMRKHDDDLTDRDPTGYNWGRPINEVRTALEKLTGTTHGELELCHIHGRGGTPIQHYLKRALFQRCAERWSRWWDANWDKHIHDRAYSKVELPELQPDAEMQPLNRDVNLVVSARMSNMMCESVFAKKQYRVFYDIDTGRGGVVHRRWSGKVSADNWKIVSKWAVSEGYDLMGTEVTVNGKQVFVLRLLQGEAWEVPFEEHWTKYEPASAAEMMRRGRPVKEFLTVAKGDAPDYYGTGAFFVITRDGTPAFVRLGIEVHDTSLKVGIPSPRDNELNPKAFRKGRRFALRLLSEADAAK